MSLESQIFDALKGLVNNRVYPDVAPENAPRPYIVYQAISGQAVNFLDQGLPGTRNARVQIDVWGDTRGQVATLAYQVEIALRQTAALQTNVEGAAHSSWEPETNLRGSQQDFSVWY